MISAEALRVRAALGSAATGPLAPGEVPPGLPNATPEAALLDLLAIHTQLTAADAAPLLVAPPPPIEGLSPLCSPGAAILIADLAAAPQSGACLYWLRLAAARRQRPPARLIPRLLDAYRGCHDAADFHAVAAALGVIGRAAAALDTAFAFAAGDHPAGGGYKLRGWAAAAMQRDAKAALPQLLAQIEAAEAVDQSGLIEILLPHLRADPPAALAILRQPSKPLFSSWRIELAAQLDLPEAAALRAPLLEDLAAILNIPAKKPAGLIAKISQALASAPLLDKAELVAPRPDRPAHPLGFDMGAMVAALGEKEAGNSKPRRDARAALLRLLAAHPPETTLARLGIGGIGKINPLTQLLAEGLALGARLHDRKGRSTQIEAMLAAFGRLYAEGPRAEETAYDHGPTALADLASQAEGLRFSATLWRQAAASASLWAGDNQQRLTAARDIARRADQYAAIEKVFS